MPRQKKQVNHEFTFRIGSLLTVVALANEHSRYPGMVVQIVTKPDADDGLKRLLAERCKDASLRTREERARPMASSALPLIAATASPASFTRLHSHSMSRAANSDVEVISVAVCCN